MAKKKTGKSRFFWGFCLLLYSLLMLWLLFGQRWGTSVYRQELAENINLIPFATLGRYWQLLQGGDGGLVRHAFINLAGNVVMFIPLGALLPAVYSRLRGFFQTFFFSVMLIATVEALQYATLLGTCDIDDLILNLAGVILGYILYRCTRQ